MDLIRCSTIAQGWLEACEWLIQQPEWIDTTVILHIENPTRVSRQDRAVAKKLDTFLVSHDKYSNHTVAETIFPGYEYIRRGVEGVYNVYPNEIYPRIKDLPEIKRWGNYAHRILRRQEKDGTTYNPLKACIGKMLQKNPVHAAYELGLGFGFDVATYDDDDDRSARMGGPCLSHLSFKLLNGKVHLTVMYRSHYYVQRAYGNLLGLARLQAFVADQVGLISGPLVCHSTMARLEYGKEWGWPKTEVPPLLKACGALMRQPEEIAITQEKASS